MSFVSKNPLLLAYAQQEAAGGISRSLRFNSSDSAYLSRTPASAGNRRTWTWAGWVKRSNNSGYQALFSANNGNSTAFDIAFNGDNFGAYLGIGPNLVAAAVYRDFSAWYHILCAADTTQATASNRIKLYINGEQITAFSASNYPSQNFDYDINNTTAHAIGRISGSSSGYFSGYLADIYFIDGQALTPSSFTETDATTGQLIPKAFSGSYGSQGWHLEFADNSSNTATTLGKDTSGLGNNWTPNNLSVTAGAGNDSLVDVPTNGAQTDTGVGGEVRGNYATLNPLFVNAIAATLSNGNLDYTVSSGSYAARFASIGMSSGKWYAEFLFTVVSGGQLIGIANNPPSSITFVGDSASGYSYAQDGKKYTNGSGVAYGASYTNGDIIGIAFDADAGTLVFYKNGSSQGTAFSSIAAGSYFFGISGNSGTTGSWNFGQRPFAYTAPSGFKALNTANLPAPLVTKPNTVFDVKLYTGNGSTQTISGLGFSPDLVWIKSRNNAGDPVNGVWHNVFDTIRTAGKALFTNTTSAEATNDSNGYLSAFNSDGFAVTAGSNSPNNVNNGTGTYVAWTWDAGSSTVTNTQGSITSSVRANATAGFSIVTYTGNGNSASTVGHGLGVAPPLVIAKSRSTSDSWVVYTNIIDGSNDYLLLNSTAAKVDSSHSSPTSTVFNPSLTMGPSVTCVAYCFAPVVGYSSFGSYTGNGSADGPFVYTGFRPRWLLVKYASASNDWYVFDAARNPYNAVSLRLCPNGSFAEADVTASIGFDFLSNGFKVFGSNAYSNASGGTYIYAAFAESPFNYARAR